jgi:PAS domain S-box-containing protein
LQPDTQRIVVVGGTTDIDRQVLQRVKQAAESLSQKVQIDFWDEQSLAELRRSVAALPPHTAILFARMFRDGAGQAVISSQVSQWIAEWANVPVYAMSDANFGTGAVGGEISSIEAFSRRAGEQALRVLNGADMSTIPLEIRADTVPMFDWRALQRWRISESRLPAGSVVRFRPESIWDKYRQYVLGAFVIFSLQMALITDLLLQRRRRRKIEAELSESRQFMDLATEAGGIGLWARDLIDDHFWANSRLRSMLGFAPDDEVEVKDVLARINCEDRERMMSVIERAQETGKPFEVEFRTAIAGAPERWIAARGQFVYGPHGRALRRMGTMIDITERKQAEEGLEKERAFLRQVIDVAPNFIFAKDREGRFTLANKAVAEAYGTTVEGLIGKTDADFNSNAEEVEFFHKMDLSVIDSGQERFIAEEHITDAQGRVRWLQTVKRPIREQEGAARQVLGASTEITARKTAEAELQRHRDELAHVTRVSTLGELAASLAHELNQPLTGILSNAQAAQRFLALASPDLDEIREILQDIVEDDNRASEVIQKLRALYKKEALTIAPVDLPGVVRDVIQLVHSDAVLHNVQVAVEADAELPSALGDRVQLQQVVINLLRNAIDAMTDRPANDRSVSIRAQRQDNDFLRVAVSDRGIGLATDMIEKIFQPFYTTKSHGLGMGLSVSRSIIEAHGGRLWAENNSDRGMTFYFTVPVEKSVG